MIDVLLGDSHTVTVYARKPSLLDDSVITNRLVTIIKGELTDVAGIRRAMMGIDAIISSLGPKVKNGPFHPSNTPLAKAYGVILELMKEKGIRRIILLGTTSMKDPNDKFSLEFKALVSGVALFATNAYRVCVFFLKTTPFITNPLIYMFRMLSPLAKGSVPNLILTIPLCESPSSPMTWSMTMSWDTSAISISKRY